MNLNALKFSGVYANLCVAAQKGTPMPFTYDGKTYYLTNDEKGKDRDTFNRATARATNEQERKNIKKEYAEKADKKQVC